jgi:hypothetical protein
LPQVPPTGVVWRDLHRAAQELTGEVNAEISAGWKPPGDIASIEPGTGAYLIQALTKRGSSLDDRR